MSTTIVKNTNPKDAIGSSKPSLSCVPMHALYEVAAVLQAGAMKYGRHNWRAAGVRASVYVDANFRHMTSFWEGETYDPETLRYHVAHAAAGCLVLLDSMIRGNWVDDRPPVHHGTDTPSGRTAEFVAGLKQQYPDPIAPWTEETLDFSQSIL